MLVYVDEWLLKNWKEKKLSLIRDTNIWHMTSSFYWLMSFVKQKVVIGIYLELNRISKRSIPKAFLYCKWWVEPERYKTLAKLELESQIRVWFKWDLLRMLCLRSPHLTFLCWHWKESWAHKPVLNFLSKLLVPAGQWQLKQLCKIGTCLHHFPIWTQ